MFFSLILSGKSILFILHQAFLSTASSNAFVGYSWGRVGGLLLLKTASEMSVRNGAVQVDLYLPQSPAKNKDKNVSLAVSGCLQEILLQAKIVCCNPEMGFITKQLYSIFIWDSCWGGRFL